MFLYRRFGIIYTYNVVNKGAYTGEQEEFGMKKSIRTVKKAISLFLSIVLISMPYRIDVFGAADREQAKTGYIFLPEDYNAAAVNRNAGMYAYRSVADEKYITEQLPAIRDQGKYGCCWAFSSIALAEISVLKQENVSLDLSELHLHILHIMPQRMRWEA